MNFCFAGVLTKSHAMELNIFPEKCFAKNLRFRLNWFECDDRYCRFYHSADKRKLAAVCVHIKDEITIESGKNWPVFNSRSHAQKKRIPATQMRQRKKRFSKLQ